MNLAWLVTKLLLEQLHQNISVGSFAPLLYWTVSEMPIAFILTILVYKPIASVLCCLLLKWLQFS